MLIVLLVLEPDISGVAVQRIYIKTAKMAAFCEELLSENDFETVFATSVLMTNMVPLLRQFKRSLYTDQKDE